MAFLLMFGIQARIILQTIINNLGMGDKRGFRFTVTAGFSIHRVKNLDHMFKTRIGQCRIYLHTKSTFKRVYH